jgi:hypothetical protein
MLLKRKVGEKPNHPGENKEIRLAGKPGFEPRFHDPESCAHLSKPLQKIRVDTVWTKLLKMAQFK